MNMDEAIQSVLVTTMKTALAAYYPATLASNSDAYINTREDAGDIPAFTGQWYCSIHGVVAQDLQGKPGELYTRKLWSALITISVRSSFAPDSKVDLNPMQLKSALLNLANSYMADNSWAIMAAINTAFNNTNTNGLTTPFQVMTPFPQSQQRPLSWAKAVGKSTSQKELLSATIRLSNALHIQPTGNTA